MNDEKKGTVNDSWLTKKLRAKRERLEHEILEDIDDKDRRIRELRDEVSRLKAELDRDAANMTLKRLAGEYGLYQDEILKRVGFQPLRSRSTSLLVRLQRYWVQDAEMVWWDDQPFTRETIEAGDTLCGGLRTGTWKGEGLTLHEVEAADKTVTLVLFDDEREEKRDELVTLAKKTWRWTR